MDNVLIDYIINEFKKESGIDLKNDKMAFQRLREPRKKPRLNFQVPSRPILIAVHYGGCKWSEAFDFDH